MCQQWWRVWTFGEMTITKIKLPLAVVASLFAVFSVVAELEADTAILLKKRKENLIPHWIWLAKITSNKLQNTFPLVWLHWVHVLAVCHQALKAIPKFKKIPQLFQCSKYFSIVWWSTNSNYHWKSSQPHITGWNTVSKEKGLEWSVIILLFQVRQGRDAKYYSWWPDDLQD